jgi:DNA-binding MarR family transcriptional regulator
MPSALPAAASRELVAAVVATADTLLREGQRLLKPLGLTVAQYNVLTVLALAPGGTGLSQRELGDELIVDRSNVTGLLDRMEKAGWVRRADDIADRRIYRVRLTPAGRRLLAKADAPYNAAVARVAGALSGPQTRDLLAALGRLQVAAKAWDRR